MTAESEKLMGIKDMSEVSERRLWKALGDISSRLGGIEVQLSDVVRLQERMHSHEETNKRYGRRLEDHDDRVRNIELWQANHGDRSTNERLLIAIQRDMGNLKKDVIAIQNLNSRVNGQKDVSKTMLQWLVAILLVTLTWALNKG